MVTQEVNAGKDPVKGGSIWELLQDSEKIVVASGKKILEFTPADSKAMVIEKVSGRAGNLRAPALKIGKTFYIGYNEKLYNENIK